MLIVLVIGNGALAVGPTTAARLRSDGSVWTLVVVLSVSVGMLLCAVVLSVFKPGGRLRRSG
jgi:low affinity Fe/Cu permease